MNLKLSNDKIIPKIYNMIKNHKFCNCYVIILDLSRIEDFDLTPSDINLICNKLTTSEIIFKLFDDNKKISVRYV